jgi:hypothetical protein
MWQLPRLGVYGFGKAGNDGCIDRIGLRPLADRLREVTNLRWVDDRQRQMSTGDGRRHDGLETARRLHRDQARRNPTQPLEQLTQAFAVTRDGKGFPLGRTCTSSRSFETSMPT